MHPIRPGVEDTAAGDDGAVQISTGGENHGFGLVAGPQLCLQPGDYAVCDQEFCDHGLLQIQIVLQLQDVLHVLLVASAVCLGPERMDRWAFSPVQHPVLDAAGVRRPAHFATQCVQLPDQVPLSRAANGGVAGHVANGVQIDGENDSFHPQPCRRQSCFNSSMPGAHDGHVISASTITQVNSPFQVRCGPHLFT